MASRRSRVRTPPAPPFIARPPHGSGNPFVFSAKIGRMLPHLLDLVSRLGFSAILVSLFGYFPSAAETPARVVHVFVAPADYRHQGIIPVSAKLGDGEVPSANLYWGAAYGVKTYFRTSSAWELVWFGRGPK